MNREDSGGTTKTFWIHVGLVLQYRTATGETKATVPTMASRVATYIESLAENHWNSSHDDKPQSMHNEEEKM
jgi:hypothetical protein